MPSRRAGGGGGTTPKRQRGKHGGHLRRQLEATVRAPRRVDAGVDPRLVFKINSRSRPSDTSFEGRGLDVLGESTDYTYFVLAEDDGAALSEAIEQYTKTGELGSFFNLVDDIEPYGPEDRRGPGIDTLLNGYSGKRIVDVSIWPAASNSESSARIQTLETVLLNTNGEILLRSVSARRIYIRVAVSSDGLKDLLDTSVVESIRTPPVPYIDFRDWRDLTPSDVTISRQPSAVVGVLDDSPAAAHPLLNGLVLSTESLAPATYQWQQPGSHGTEVVGRILYANLEEELRSLSPLTAAGEVRVVRILEPDPQGSTDQTRFPTYALPHILVEDAIRYLHDKFSVKIFNLSVGYSEPYNDLHVGPLTEVLDDLIRELDIVIIVPTGNAAIDLSAHTASGHHIIDDKPEYFFAQEHRLAEPGPAALAVTVGAIALSGAPAELPQRIGWRAAADSGEASPFSRSGPGLGTAPKRSNKPDLTHYGGNVVVNDSGHAVQNDLGASIISTSYRAGNGKLFATVNGTSFAVPAVARVAADISHEYPDAGANLIRALLAGSAERPTPADAIPETYKRHDVYGYGIPQRERAVTSNRNRVTMTYEGSLAIDTVQIHPLPVPELFRRGSGGERTITATIAFDPPVRRQRREYLAGSMKLDIFRDIDSEELAEILQKQDPDDSNELISDRRRLKLEPGSNSFTNSTLHVRRWVAKKSFVNDHETFFVVVTHRAQTWARDDAEYTHQSYALAVTLEDQNLVQADLHQLLTHHVQIPARVRLRA